MKTTLCYIEQQGKYLMMLRNKKDHDVNQGKYVGVGGKFLPGEEPDDCLLREVKEETGFDLTEYEYRGIVHFVSDTWDDEDMYLYIATGFIAPEGIPLREGLPLPECTEGTFEWVEKSSIENLRTWEGDRFFLRALASGRKGIDMTLSYRGDDLVEATESGESLR